MFNINKFSKKFIFQAGICLLITTLIPLTIHIHILEWVKPKLDALMHGFQPESSAYPSIIIFMAHITAFITVGLVMFLYYHTQHLLIVKHKILKAFLVACILLEIKGDLLRQPLMDYLLNYNLGMKNPLLFVVLNQLDKWLANFFIALCLVYLCPKKREADEPVYLRSSAQGRG